MGNLGGAEVLVILLVALIVLGPAKLPEAARQVGKAVNEVRRISGGFQKEMREALQEPLAEDKARGRSLAAERQAARAAGKNPYADPDESSDAEPSHTEPSNTEPSHTEPSNTEPSNTEPSNTEPSEEATDPAHDDESA